MRRPPNAGRCAINEPRRILIVDDERDFTEVMRWSLENEGYAIRTENDSKRAGETAREFRPDLILLDVNMPLMEGPEVAAQFRSDAALRRIPILFLTSIVEPEETQGRGQERGGEVFIAKASTLDEILQCIRRYLPPPV